MSFRRIVLALGAPGATAALTTAIDLARATNAELRGLFVEDTGLISLAAMPFAGEVGFPSPARRALDVAAMERGLRAQARRVERELAALLASETLKWTFDVVRGRISAELLAVADDADLAVVSLAASVGATPARVLRAFRGASVPLLIVGERPRARGSIAVLASPGADAPHLADVVAALAPRYGRSALFVQAESRGAAGEAWRREMEALLAARALAGTFRDVSQASTQEFARVLAARMTGVVVALVRDAESCEDLLDVLACPVLVLPEAGPPTRDDRH